MSEVVRAKTQTSSIRSANKPKDIVVFLKVTAVFLTISLSSLSYTYAASDKCDRYLEDIFIGKANAMDLFTVKYAQEIKELTESGRLNPANITLETLVYGKDKKTGKTIFMLMDEEGYTLLFDKSLSKNWEQLDSQEIGFINNDYVEKNFEILSQNLYPRTIKNDVLLLPQSEFGPKAVRGLLTQRNKNADKILYWEKELQYLIDHPYYDRESGTFMLSATAISKAEFIDVSIKGLPEEKLTLMIVENVPYYLSKKQLGGWSASNAKQGLLSVKSFGYNSIDSKTSKLTFVDQKGTEFKITSGGLEKIGSAQFNNISLEHFTDTQKKFLSLYQNEVQEILNTYKQNLNALEQLQAYKVDGDGQDYVALIAGIPFYFNKKGATIINSNRTWDNISLPNIGFLNQNRIQIPIDGKHLMIVENSVIKIYPIEEKSIDFLKFMVQKPQIPEANKNLLADFEQELKEILSETSFTASELANANVLDSVFDNKTGQEVKILSIGDTYIVFNSNPLEGDTFYKNKKFTILSNQSFFGMLNEQERTFTTIDYLTLIVNSKGVELREEYIQKFADSFIGTVLEGKDKSFSFLNRAMISQFRNEIMELIIAGKITTKDLSYPNSVLAYSPKSETLFWSITAKGKTYLFDANKKADGTITEFLDLDTAIHGNKILSDAGHSMVISRSIGFQSQLVKREQSPVLEEFKMIQAAKSEFALGRELNPEELDKIFDASTIGFGEVGADNLSMANKGNFTDDQLNRRKQKLLDHGFSTEEVDDLLDFEVL